MKWSDSIAPGPSLRDVRLLVKAPAQDWEAHLREREEAAYENGRRDGERASGEQLLKQRNETVELQNGVLNSLQQALPQLIQENELALISLALETAQKIVAGLPIDSQMVETVVRDALRQVEDTAEITIQLHSDDLALMQNNHSTLLNGLPETGPLRFVGSSEITRGGCLVQTRFGIIDARRETKMEQLRKTLIA
ncbi:MAG TPA: FliH/SctL family protein [Verrucomicrobiae bacterium]